MARIKNTIKEPPQISDEQQRALLKELLHKIASRTNARDTRSCEHLGDEISGNERERLGLSHLQRWSTCNHPSQPLGSVVCPCKGCGIHCLGFIT